MTVMLYRFTKYYQILYKAMRFFLAVQKYAPITGLQARCYEVGSPPINNCMYDIKIPIYGELLE